MPSRSSRPPLLCRLQNWAQAEAGSHCRLCIMFDTDMEYEYAGEAPLTAFQVGLAAVTVVLML